MGNRKEGWYWCRLGDEWAALRNDDASIDCVDEIGPRIPAPDEPWKTVPIIPTPAMKKAARDAFASDGNGWSSMLKAAPKPDGS